VLVDAGADEAAKSLDGVTALNMALVLGHAGVAKILLAAGADLADSMPESGMLPLNEAAGFGYVGVARVLLDAGADVAARSGAGGTTALHRAAEVGNWEMAR